MTARKDRTKTQKEMSSTLTQYRDSSKLYSPAEGKNAEISNVIASRIFMLDEILKNGKADIRDLEQVKAVSFAYLDNCMKVGVIPTFEGLAFSLGYTRRRLYYVISEGKYPSAEFLDMLRTLFADILQISSSKRILDNATSIFILKSMTGMGFSDKGEEPAIAKGSVEDGLSKEQLMEKFGDILDE